jgi:hypothetical protein
MKVINNAPNMRLQPTAQLAAKNHAASFVSLAMPAQKSRIIQAFLAPALLGAPEALSVGWLSVPNLSFCRVITYTNQSLFDE